LAEDGSLWRAHFQRKWANYEPICAKASRFDNVAWNWKLRYRNMLQTFRLFRVCHIQVQSDLTYFGITGKPLAEKPVNHRDDQWYDTYTRRGTSSVCFGSIPSVVAKVNGHYWSAGTGVEDYLVGHEIGAQEHRKWGNTMLLSC
jgi:hypothetical protein